jgi:geranylgeranyl reductase family protein
MDNCDVLVVGAGPAGATCAWKLKQSGLDVLILDKADFPRDKVCAGWITPAVIDELELDLLDYAKNNTLQPLTGFRISMLGNKEVETCYGKPVSYGIRRCEFDQYLLTRSQARIASGQALQEIRRENNTWIINNTIQTPMVIGAGGHFCPVARFLGAKPGSTEPAVAAQEIEFLMNEQQRKQCSVKPEVPELFFCNDLKGYGWIFRKGDHLNIGLGRQDQKKLSSHVEAFVEYLKKQGKIPTDIPGRFQGHAYLLYGDAPRQLMDDGILLIGDAAGLAYAQSGEGIRPAIESALMAANTIIKANKDYEIENLQPYYQQLTTRFGARNQRHNLSLAQWLPSGFTHFLAARLLSSRWFSRHLVLDRWFFHAHQQPIHL